MPPKPIETIFPKPPSPCTCMNVRRASRAITQYYDSVLSPCGLTIAQMSLLKTLAAAEPTTITDLAGLMRIDRTTLNRNMKPLAESGLIEICAGKDSRTRQVRSTAAGKKACEKAWELWGEAQVAIQGYLGEEDSARLLLLLSKLEALAP